MSSLALGLLLGMSWFALEGCGPTKVTTNSAPDIEKYRIKTIAVLPFEALATPQTTERRDTEILAPQGVLRSDISLGIPPTVERQNQPTATVPAVAADHVTRIVYGKLRQWGGILTLTPSETGRVAASLGPQAAKLPQPQLVRQVAEQMKADAVLVGRVLIYQERAGSKWGGDPAVVGFELKLVGADGKVLWVGNYFERQRPLIEDLAGFLDRGGVFVTADELAAYGAEHVFKEFPFGTPAER
ncbi:MAG: hypothetical protein EPO61_05180 [Nitrospirae bacterium]|nr:MAG: hypothetical protein EPO61_05180 [Nitrospirota bacterium]